MSVFALKLFSYAGCWVSLLRGNNLYENHAFSHVIAVFAADGVKT
jgi:hypothetical protein